ncbi:hypothetical protein EJB05_01432, partial [Eragrostis curvula]
MIAHLQSVFLGSSDLEVDPNFCSSNSCSLVEQDSYSTGASLNITTNVGFDHQLVDNLASANEAKVGNKRKIQLDELMIHCEKDCADPAATRARKKSEKDSQSRYAKKRRERINESLRVLQELIPNGTKVDISTMLEEAVEYVKFLHLQIKLLSSDELWMYAPLAYHGINIGMHLNGLSAQER